MNASDLVDMARENSSSRGSYDNLVDMARENSSSRGSYDRQMEAMDCGFCAVSRRPWMKLQGWDLAVEFWDGLSLSWRSILSRRPRTFREWFTFFRRNLLALTVTTVFGVLTVESSTNELRHSLTTTVLFPMYFPHAVGLAISAKDDTSVGVGNFLGFFVSRTYSAWRGNYVISATRVFVILAASVLGAAEVGTAALYLRKFLCAVDGRRIPSIESIREALQFVSTLFVSSIVFETLIAVVICSTPLVRWKNFWRFWGTTWLSVLAAFLTVSPVVMHLFVWKHPRSLFRAGKVFEALAIASITSLLMLLIFITNIFRAVAHPLPYLLYPVVILTAFRFNRLGCAVVVMVMGYICAWTSIRGRGALYRMAGSPVPHSSPKLIVQVELYVSVLGLLGILLAAAVREKKQLARALHTMNAELENTVNQRTQELVMANEELKESQRKAEEASQAKSDFLANMSHEIRTPIHGIMGLTALLLDSVLSMDQRDNLMSVQECASLLLHIINSILDLAKIEAGRVELEFVPFNVRRLVNSTIRMLTTRAQERKLDLHSEIDSGVPEWMVGDSGKIQQCLLNLRNAVKFTHEGTVAVHVTVYWSDGKNKAGSRRRALRLENQSIDLSSSGSSQASRSLTYDHMTSAFFSVFENPLDWQNDSQGHENSGGLMVYNGAVFGQGTVVCVPLKFEVHDTGIGISQEKLQDIFTPFKQGDASTARVYGGTGLGLCIVQRFVELLGGKLLAESEVGKGSSFGFCVPLGFSDLKDEEQRSKTLRSSLDSPRYPKLPSGTEYEIDKSDTLGLISSATNSERGKDEGEAPLVVYRRPEHVRMTKEGTSERRIVSRDYDREHSTGSRGNTLRTVEEDLPTLCTPMQTVRLPNKSDSGFGSLNDGFEKQPGTDTVECLPLFPKSGDSSNFYNGMSCSPNNVVDASKQLNRDSFSSRQQSMIVQAEKSPHLVDDTSKCNVTVQSNDRRDRGESRDSSLLPESESTVVENPVPSLLGKTEWQDLKGSETQNKETQSVKHSSQESSGQFKVNAIGEHRKHPHLRVLLAEDNLINQKVATRQLVKHGYTVTIVGDGVQALDAVKANHDNFDLVLMDVQMPMMDGLEATTRIRAVEVQRGWKRLPVLGLTAHAIQGYERICLSSGMDGYLGKPFDINQLLVAVDKFVPASERLSCPAGVFASWLCKSALVNLKQIVVTSWLWIPIQISHQDFPRDDCSSLQTRL